MQREMLNEWKQHPVTKELTRTLQSAIEDALQTPIINVNIAKTYTSDDVAIRLAKREGFLEGLAALKDAYDLEIGLGVDQ